MFYRDIICLANSYKLGGRCVAGKDINEMNWVRPVSDSPTGELSLQQINIAVGNHQEPRLFDIIRIPLLVPKPEYFQPENILIDSATPWQIVGGYDQEGVNKLLDTPTSLWENLGARNDRVSTDILKSNPPLASLYFIKPSEFTLHNKIRELGNLQTRAVFTYNDVQYDLVVTDPVIKEKFKEEGVGTYKFNRDVYICVSLGEEFHLEHYKLVASVFEIENGLSANPKVKAYTFKEIRVDYPQAYAPWTAEDDRLLLKKFKDNCSIDEMAAFFQRKNGAITSRLKKLGVI